MHYYKFNFYQVYSVNVSGTIVQQNISIGGSGSSYLYGFMDSQYKDGMTQEECENLVLNGTYHTIFFHSQSLLMFL